MMIASLHSVWYVSLAAALIAGLAGCTASSPEAALGLANPAAVACVQSGGRLEIERSPAGERGICLLPGGVRCDQWAWFRKEAGACCTTAAPAAQSDIKPCR